MKVLKRLLRTLAAPKISKSTGKSLPFGEEPTEGAIRLNDGPTPEGNVPQVSIPPPALGDIICVDEVENARFFINDLFQRRFGSTAPDYPRHFVCFHKRDPSHFSALGYIHYSPYEDCWLCGGMVMDDRAYRRMPASHRDVIRRHGGVAEIMLRHTFALLRDAPAIWGYVGDKQAEVVDLRAGFVHTGRTHLMVVWNRELPESERQARIEKVASLGPF